MRTVRCGLGALSAALAGCGGAGHASPPAPRPKPVVAIQMGTGHEPRRLTPLTGILDGLIDRSS